MPSGTVTLYNQDSVPVTCDYSYYQDIAANKSIVTMSFYITANMQSTQIGMLGIVSGNGLDYNYEEFPNNPYGVVTKNLMKTLTTMNVPHNSDGTKTLPLSFTLTWNGVVWNGSKTVTINTISGNASVALDRIIKPNPTTPTNIQPSSGNYSSGVTLSWNSSSISSGSISRYDVYINDSYIGNTTSTSYGWTIPSGNNPGTTYRVGVEAISSYGTTSSRGYASGTFYKTYPTPSTPTNIMPNSGTYTTSVYIVWQPSSVSQGSISNYDVFINGVTVTNTSATSFTWTIPSGDAVGTVYRVGIEAISNYNIRSARGYASGDFTKGQINRAPGTPSITINNTYVNNRYLAEGNLSITLSQVTDPDGDTVRYAIFGQYLSGGNWLSIGDSNNCILWSTDTRTANVDVKNYSRGTQFRVWGRATDDSLNSPDTSTISNIYRNQAPTKPGNITPASYVFYTNTITINWGSSTDSDGQGITYSTSVSKNGGAYTSLTSSQSSNSYTYTATNDSYNTDYNFKVIASDGMTTSLETISPTYTKGDPKPPTPTSIVPNGGYYKHTITMSWINPNPSYETITGYNIYINNVKIGNTTGATATSYQWAIPEADVYGKSYLISVESISQSGQTSLANATSPFYKADNMDKNITIAAANNTIVKTTTGDEYYYQIILNYAYVNSNVSLSYEIQYSIIDRNSSEDLNGIIWSTVTTNTTSKTHTHDISTLSRDNSKIIYRVRGTDSYGDKSKWGYSAFYNIYIKDTESNLNIIYPNDKAILNVKRPHICINYYPRNLTNRWLCIDINDQIKDNYFVNDKGYLNIKCDYDLIEGINKIKIYEKVNLPVTGIHICSGKNLEIEYKEENIVLYDYIESEKINDMYLQLMRYRVAYNLPTPTLLKDIADKCDMNKDGLVTNADVDIIASHYQYTDNISIDKYDINNDGVIDIYDITLASKFIGHRVDAEKIIKKCDVNGDGIITEEDIDIIGSYYNSTDSIALSKYDINNDGVIDIYDIVIASSYINHNVYDNEVAKKCDFDNDGIVTQDDYDEISSHYNSTDPLILQKYDINKDGIIDIYDISIVGKYLNYKIDAFDSANIYTIEPGKFIYLEHLYNLRRGIDELVALINNFNGNIPTINWEQLGKDKFITKSSFLEIISKMNSL